MFIACFAVLLLVRNVQTSLGNLEQGFVECMSQCIEKFDCPSKVDNMGWIFVECFSCKERCMWMTVKDFMANSNQVPKFYGKWPFQSVVLPLFPYIPVQEIASVLFSLLNIASAMKFCYVVRRGLTEKSRLKMVWTIYGIFGIISWFCSVLFHWSDFWLTEYMDYFSAFGFVTYALFASISFAFPGLQRSALGRILWFSLAAGLIAFYVKHVNSLLIFFDYGYNMMCSVTIGLLTATIYFHWILRNWYLKTLGDRKSIIYLTLSILLFFIALSFEIFDFPPVFWLIDAHALFHLLTVPVPLLMTEFVLREDAFELGQLAPKIPVFK